MKKKKEELKKNEQNPYQSDKLAKIPSWFKILLLKFWVAAATFFFFAIANPFISGESIYDAEKYFVFMAFGLSIFNEYIAKPIIRLMNNSRDNTFKFNMVNLKGVKSFFLNLLYAFVIMCPVAVVFVKCAEHGIVINLFGTGEYGIEPITMAFIYVIFDYSFVGLKNLIIYLYKKIKFNRDEKKAKELEAKLSSQQNDEEDNKIE